MKILPVNEKLVDKVFKDFMKNRDKPSETAKRNLRNFYINKINKDAEEVSKQGISSKTYFVEDFDIEIYSFLFQLKRFHGYDYVINGRTFDIIWK